VAPDVHGALEHSEASGAQRHNQFVFLVYLFLPLRYRSSSRAGDNFKFHFLADPAALSVTRYHDNVRLEAVKFTTTLADRMDDLVGVRLEKAGAEEALELWQWPAAVALGTTPLSGPPVVGDSTKEGRRGKVLATLRRLQRARGAANS
jgi:hypothetical protein